MASSSNAERAADTLLVLGDSGSFGMTLKDLAASLGQPKPAVLRTLTALSRRGFVVQIGRGRYRLGPSVFALAARDNTALRDAERWRRVLRDLAARYGFAFTLVGRAGVDAVILDLALGRVPMPTLINGVGARLPLGVGAGSLAILGCLPADERAQVLAHNEPHFVRRELDPLRVGTLVERAVMLGYSWESNEYLPEMGGVAVPILEDGDVSVRNVITMAAPTAFLTIESVNEVVEDVRCRIKETLASNFQGGVRG
jgi:DNA-binding IclR family transcriptional regulator